MSRADDAATINAGIFQTDIYEDVWRDKNKGFVEEPFCIVCVRTGEIVGQHDIWFSLNNEQTPQHVVAILKEGILPFLERLRMPEAMDAFLEKETGSYPLPRIYLAALKNRRGDTAAACAILKHVREKARGDWRNRVNEIAERIGCN